MVLQKRTLPVFIVVVGLGLCFRASVQKWRNLFSAEFLLCSFLFDDNTFDDRFGGWTLNSSRINCLISVVAQHEAATENRTCARSYTHTCSHLMITLCLYQVFQQLYYCRKRGKAYSPFPPLLNDWRPFGTSLPSQLKFHSCNIWIAMETAFILWAPTSLCLHPDTTVSPSLYWVRGCSLSLS